jgi:C4-type Zn-finger protein
MSDKTDLKLVVANHFFIVVHEHDDEGINIYNPAIGLISDETPDNVLVVTNIINKNIDEAIKATLTIAVLLADAFSNSIIISDENGETAPYEKTVTDFLYQGNVSFDYSKQVH